MFGISGYEFLVIILVAFLVIKPEDAPKIVRKIKYYFTKIKNFNFYVQNSIKQTIKEIEDSVDLEDEKTVEYDVKEVVNLNKELNRKD